MHSQIARTNANSEMPHAPNKCDFCSVCMQLRCLLNSHPFRIVSDSNQPPYQDRTRCNAGLKDGVNLFSIDADREHCRRAYRPKRRRRSEAYSILRLLSASLALLAGPAVNLYDRVEWGGGWNRGGQRPLNARLPPEGRGRWWRDVTETSKFIRLKRCQRMWDQDRLMTFQLRSLSMRRKPIWNMKGRTERCGCRQRCRVNV